MYTLALAGSTKRTVQVAQTLLNDDRFQLKLIITPSPRKLGRDQVLTKNPLHLLAEKNDLPVVLIDQKLDAEVQQQIEKALSTPIDFLLVVDFGFLVPKWLLALPTIAPLNIHPSLLPRWRGSSPGQFVLLHGEPESAVTLMVMNEALDEGPVIAQLPFAVDQSWTQTEYYQHSFDLICAKLGELLVKFASQELPATPQGPSPTLLADRLSKADSFRPWTMIKLAMTDGTEATQLERASRAYSPWPKLWTLIPTSQGEERLIIHRCGINQAGLLELQQVQLAGKKITSWSEVKNNWQL